MDTRKAERVLRSIQKIPHKHFVLHGSAVRSNTLVPNRPDMSSFTNQRKTKGFREKGVYGTLVREVALIYATLPNDVQWRFVRKGKFFHVRWRDKEVALHAGYIHVCRRSSFDRGALVIASKRAVKVVRTFRIDPEVLIYLWEKKRILFLP